MFLLSLCITVLKPGKRSQFIKDQTQFKLAASSAILPNITEGFTFTDSKGTEYTEFPQAFKADEIITITPAEGSTGISITLTVAPTIPSCATQEYILNGVFKTNNTKGYYDSKRCYTFFPVENPKMNLLFESDTTFDNFQFTYLTSSMEAPKSYAYSYSSVSISQTTISISLESKYANYVLSVTAVDNMIYQFGDFEKSFTDEISLPIAPNSVFVAHNIDGIEFEQSDNKIADGIYFNKEEPFNVVARKSGNNNLVYSITRILQFMNITDLNVQIVTGDTSNIYATRNYNYSTKNNNVYFQILTSPHLQKYKMIGTGQSQDMTLYNTTGGVVQYLIPHGYYSYKGYPVIAKTIAFYIPPFGYDSYYFGLESSEIMSEYSGKETIREGTSAMIYGTEERQDAPSRYKSPLSSSNINYFNGTYPLTIPAEGRYLTFQNSSLIIFHNGKSFTGKLDGTEILGTTGHYVFNLTTQNAPFFIKPLNNKTMVANVTVIWYGYSRSTTSDVIVVSPSHEVYFQVSKKEELNGVKTNLSLKDDQWCSFYIASSSKHTITYVNDDNYEPRYYKVPQLYPDDYDYNSTSSYYEAYTSGSTKGSEFYLTFKVDSTAKPETEEIYGLFLGPLSYTDLERSYYKPEKPQLIYHYGSKYSPRNTYYDNERSYTALIVGLICGFAGLYLLMFLCWVCCWRLDAHMDQSEREAQRQQNTTQSSGVGIPDVDVSFDFSL